MQTAKIRLLLLTFFIGLAACGLKGPLYLPAEESAAPATNQESTTGSTEITEKKDKKKDSESL